MTARILSSGSGFAQKGCDKSLRYGSGRRRSERERGIRECSSQRRSYWKQKRFLSSSQSLPTVASATRTKRGADSNTLSNCSARQEVNSLRLLGFHLVQSGRASSVLDRGPARDARTNATLHENCRYSQCHLYVTSTGPLTVPGWLSC
jgi:hypothetical protein